MSDANIVTRPIVSTVVAPGRVEATVQTVTTPAAQYSPTGQPGPPGPQGPAGPQGPPGTTTARLDDLVDVVAPTPVEGDVVRFDGTVFRNFREIDLTIDGGNW